MIHFPLLRLSALCNLLDGRARGNPRFDRVVVSNVAVSLALRIYILSIFRGH